MWNLDYLDLSQRRVLRPVESRSGAFVSVNGASFVDFSSNDYLGLGHCEELRQQFRELLLETSGFGSGGSRLLGGDYTVFHELENDIASYLVTEAALFFNNGYQCNLGVISTLMGKDDVVFMDRLCHASIVDGVKLSGARFFRFRHQDMAHLEELLHRHRGNFSRALIVTESVFSMDGDISPLIQISALKNRYQCAIMVDEAHAVGVFGDRGAGVISQLGLSGQIDIVVGTFGKALGSSGAFVGVSHELKKYLIQYCRSFIYSTSLPLPVILFNRLALRYMQSCGLGSILLEKAELFRSKLVDLGLSVMGQSHIVPVMVGSDEDALALSDRFKSHGIWVSAIRPPTVPPGMSRLRFSLTMHHELDVLDKVVALFKDRDA